LIGGESQFTLKYWAKVNGAVCAIVLVAIPRGAAYFLFDVPLLSATPSMA